MTLRIFAMAALALAVTPWAAHSADPVKTTQIIVPYAAGGTTDRIGRIVAAGLAQELGSPWRAAYSSFALFALGSLVPLLPWLWISQTTAVVVSIILTSLASLFVGAFVAYSSGKRIAYGAARQLGIVLASALVTYGIGHLFGVTVG